MNPYIFVVASSLERAHFLTGKLGIPRERWRYVTGLEKLRGVKGATILVEKGLRRLDREDLLDYIELLQQRYYCRVFTIDQLVIW